MSSVFSALAKADSEIRQTELRTMALHAHDLSEIERKEFTTSLLAAWLDLHHEEAFIIASAYSTVVGGLPTTLVRSNAVFIQSALNDFVSDERSALDLLISDHVANGVKAKPQRDRKYPPEFEVLSIWPYTDELR